MVNEQHDVVESCCGLGRSPGSAKSSPCTVAQRTRAGKRRKETQGHASTSWAACKSLCRIPDNPSPHTHTLSIIIIIKACWTGQTQI